MIASSGHASKRVRHSIVGAYCVLFLPVLILDFKILLSYLKMQNVNEKQFLYDIVANNRNGIDVDK